MRVKPVPAPPNAVDRLLEIRDALPLVPEPEESCCERLVHRACVVDEETARDWLSFLRGLDLAAEGDAGYYRTRDDPSGLGEAMIEGVYGAREVRTILDDAGEPLTADEVFERFEAVPRWERRRNPDWEGVWRERVGRLLGWLTLIGRAERVEGGYRAA
ncbi:hypothetical protein [Halalkalicoccus salilacus]|uniref:hypothetical protein n=1 Tax=Halalkalicoccus TaxID=332246 RepID=UPI002F9681F7